MYSIHGDVIYCTCIPFSVLRSHLTLDSKFIIFRNQLDSDFDLESNNINNSSLRRCVPYNNL